MVSADQSRQDEYGSSADFYDYVTLYRERPDIRFYVDEAIASNVPVLEIGCGTGRVLIPTARAGRVVVGLDASPGMLAICEERLRSEPEAVRSRVSLLHGDMRNFDVAQTFALITSPFRAFQHLLTVEDQIACLTCVHRHLAERGRFVFDLFNPSLEILVQTELGTEIETEPSFPLPDGRTAQRRSRILRHDRLQQVTYHELIYYVTDTNGHTERVVHAFALRNSFKFEIEHLLARLGFAVEHVYADFDRTPFGSKYPGELIFVARRAAA